MTDLPYSERPVRTDRDDELLLARMEFRATLAARLAGLPVPLTPTLDRLRCEFKERRACE